MYVCSYISKAMIFILLENTHICMSYWCNNIIATIENNYNFIYENIALYHLCI